MSGGSSQEHKDKAADLKPFALALITVSDTRTIENDVNAEYLKHEIEALGHNVSDYSIVKDEPEAIGALIDKIAGGAARIILINGGTGISPRDTTFDVVSSMLDKTLPGFGELFRMFSYEQVGAAAMLSRATAGVYRGKVLVSMPGSPKAVELAWQKLLKPELNHLAWEVARGTTEHT